MTPRQERLAAAVRIVTGLLFIAEGAGKLTGSFVRGGFASSAREMAREAWPFWRSFLDAVVIAHAGVLGWIFASGELAVGVGLLLGLATRAASAGGIALTVAVLLGQSYVPGARWDRWITAGLTAKFALLLFVLILAADAGKRWGLDARVRRAAPPRRR